jgi:hypothetical protein
MKVVYYYGLYLYASALQPFYQFGSRSIIGGRVKYYSLFVADVHHAIAWHLAPHIVV